MTATILTQKSLSWQDLNQTIAHSQALARNIKDHAVLTQLRQRALVILLEGGLGAGKTTWTRHFFQALGVSENIKSPTYSVCEVYSTHVDEQMIELVHFDVYRFQSPDEWFTGGFDDDVRPNRIVLIEWAQLLSPYQPTYDLQLQLSWDEQGGEAMATNRVVTLTTQTQLGVEKLMHLYDE